MAVIEALSPGQIITMVRTFLKDVPMHNELREACDFTDEQIEFGVNMAISDWNITPPFIRAASLDRFPSVSWLTVAAGIWCLESQVILAIRNDIPYSDGDATVQPWGGKAQMYMAYIDRWKALIEDKKFKLKYAMNVASLYGTVLSAEFTVWNHMALYPGLASSINLSTDVARIAPTPHLDPPPRPHTLTFNQGDSWTLDPERNRWVMPVRHNIREMVDFRIIDLRTNEDARSRVQVTFNTNNTLTVAVTQHPDGRFEGQITVFAIGG